MFLEQSILLRIQRCKTIYPKDREGSDGGDLNTESMRPKAWKNDYEKEVVHIEEHACKAEAIPSGKDCQPPRRWMRRYRNSLSRGRSGPLSEGARGFERVRPCLAARTGMLQKEAGAPVRRESRHTGLVQFTDGFNCVY